MIENCVGYNGGMVEDYERKTVVHKAKNTVRRASINDLGLLSRGNDPHTGEHSYMSYYGERGKKDFHLGYSESQLGVLVQFLICFPEPKGSLITILQALINKVLAHHLRVISTGLGIICSVVDISS